MNILESGWVRNVFLGRSGSGYYLPGYETFFPRISRINLHLNEKHAFHSQTEQVEWLLSLISMKYDVITSLQGIWINIHFYCSQDLLIVGLINCFGVVQSGQKIIGSVRGRGHKIYYFSVQSGLGQKITGHYRVGVPKTLAPKDSKRYHNLRPAGYPDSELSLNRTESTGHNFHNFLCLDHVSSPGIFCGRRNYFFHGFYDMKLRIWTFNHIMCFA